jgi:hypothetical protein
MKSGILLLSMNGDELDYGEWTNEEMDLLAAEAADLLAGDGLDEPDNS